MLRGVASAWLATWFAAVAVAQTAVQTAVQATAPAPQRATLHLAGDAFVTGDLQAASDSKFLHWQSPAFVRPFEFELAAVKGVHYPVASGSGKPAGEYCFELAGGDVLYGALVRLTADVAELDIPRLGRLPLKRDHLRSLYRAHNAELVYLGPNGLAGWKQPPVAIQWRDEVGQPFASQSGAEMFADVGIPPQAVVELELSWTQRPDFMLSLASREDSPSPTQGYRFAVWSNELVATAEHDRGADLAAVQTVSDQAGRTHLVVYLDQPAGKMAVYAPDGALLANLSLPAANPAAKLPGGSGVRVVNYGGGLRLERLRVSRWNGVAPRDVQAKKSRVQRTDGTIVYGELATIEPGAKELVVRDGGQESKVAVEQLARVVFSPPESVTPRTFRVVYQDGTQISGELLRVAGDHLQLAAPGFPEPLRLPRAGLRSLVVLRATPATIAPIPAAERGKLELDGVRLFGKLVDGRTEAQSTCLVWQPEQSRTDSPLLTTAAGKITYREPAASQPERRRAPPPPDYFDWAVSFVLPEPAKPAPPLVGGRKSLHLRSGDVIPCEVARIDEAGVHIESPVAAAKVVPHDQVKAVELVLAESPPKLNKPKRERLLTLPRSQAPSPPTHLVRSHGGDFLRGRLVSLDAQKIRMEVLQELKEFPRDRASHIIWLHADELPPAPPPLADPPADPAVKPAAPIVKPADLKPADLKPADVKSAVAKATPLPAGPRVQIRRTDGNRFTIRPDQVAGQVLAGVNPVLGVCRVKLAEVDSLVLSGAIDTAAPTVAYSRWKLTPAVIPKYIQALEETPAVNAPPPGSESSLVGKPAPDFELDLVDGKKFRLSQSKGRVVVLDFWATWCGPCLQSLPKVDKVVRDFQDQKVELIAVNLEEPANVVAALLERHKLAVTTALDRDGVVAARYEATSIPYTVVIDPAGKVARVFVGADTKTADQLRAAIRELVTAKKP